MKRQERIEKEKADAEIAAKKAAREAAELERQMKAEQAKKDGKFLTIL